MATREPVQGKESRPRRTPIGARNRLEIKNRDPNYHYRIVNDTDDGRVEYFKELDYEVDTTAVVGRKRVDVPSAIGSAPTIAVGGGMNAVVMRKRKDWYEEDQKAKQELIDIQEAGMNETAKRGF